GFEQTLPIAVVGKLKAGLEQKVLASSKGISSLRPLYPVRECSAASRLVNFPHASTGFNAPCEFSNGVYDFSNSEDLRRVYKFYVSSNQALKNLEQSGWFEYLQMDRQVIAGDIIVSDPQFTLSATDQDKQWWLSKIRVPQAWEIGRGSKTITVAVVDTGINGRHEDLDDGRVGAGFVNYCQATGQNGQCSVHITSSISASQNSDDNGHGTLIAGIIGAIPNNGRGLAGINWDVRLMPVKVLDSAGLGVSSDVAAGIVWAADNGAKIINLSLGGASLEANAVLNDAIAHAFKLGVLLVAAAGNDASLVGTDLDTLPVYPVCGDADTNMVLGVAASDLNDRKAAFSNYGRNCIDLVAPGTTYFKTRDDQKGILSTYFDPSQPGKNNLYAFASGTSMAAPMVSGVAAQLLALHPDLSAVALRDRIRASVDLIDQNNPDNCGGINCTGRLGSGRLNAEKAMQTATLVADTLIGDPSGRIYLISDGVRRLVSDFVLKQREYNKASAKFLSASEIEALPQGMPLPPNDGTLVKLESQPTVFLVSKELLLPTSYLVFKSSGYDFSKIIVLPDAEVSAYRQGPQAVPANGAIFKLEGQPAVYFLQEGKRRLISLFAFQSRGLRFEGVTTVEENEFNRYPEDEKNKLQPPQDGVLLKSSGPGVYVVESGLLRELSAESFRARGYQFSRVNTIPQSELDGYVKGEPILIVGG
ncbi:MAG: S8 family serine peptidase, partial [Patescibacteria group bacterium]